MESQLGVPFKARTHSRTNSLGNFLGSHSVDLSAPSPFQLSSIPLSRAWGGSVVGGVGLLVPPPVGHKGNTKRQTEASRKEVADLSGRDGDVLPNFHEPSGQNFVTPMSSLFDL